MLNLNNIELKLVRYFYRLSLQDVADQLGISRQYLHKFETGQSIPDNAMLAKIAEIYNVKTDFFSQEKATVQEDQVHFRKLQRSKEIDKQSLISTAEYVDRLLTKVEERLSGKVTLPNFDLPKLDGFDIDKPLDIERIAEHCRKEWDLGLGPISNMTRLCENLGIVVISYDHHGENSDIDALSVTLKRPIIVRSSSKQSACRLRFDLAHELAHLLFHDGIITGCRKTESQANHFAGAFLLPRAIMIKYFPSIFSNGRFRWDNMSEFKKQFRVSKAATLYRAKQLSLLTESQYRTGIISLKNKGESKQEDEDSFIELEKPELLESCFTYLAEKEKIYVEKLCDDLYVKPVFLEHLLSIDLNQSIYTRKYKAEKLGLKVS
ncbi:XRE family transcriptional regulator [uncultured Psychrobacter sp.]|jgi:Zn-dependent peptidase ImmA (M78 family)/transcriptional regulator with XRE-family HTH domain|uniref:helix-turn-helix domain-containing protein n=2 Tax=uncultured Psychrobacter sp. TaxID=259303 RepID=UPI002627353C|nr:XRE family transcriptional regulator [uncultured Psychrobacter sp.]